MGTKIAATEISLNAQEAAYSTRDVTKNRAEGKGIRVLRHKCAI
jgi:hypothetical protein